MFLDAGTSAGHKVRQPARREEFELSQLSPDFSREVLDEARRHFTQRELAALLDYSERQIARWEHGTCDIPSAVLPAIRSAITDRTTAPEIGEGEFTFIDLFAGIGGLRLGFEAAGGRCVFTSEWDQYAQKTYIGNFGAAHPIAGDIREVEADEVPDHDVLLAGFPCQPFSLAGVVKKNALGRPHGFACSTQGTLFFDIQRIIAEKQPAAFLLENVRNLVSHDGGKTYSVIMDVLENQLGYRVHPMVVDGRRFVPQGRQRILLVGFREDVGFDWERLLSDMPAISEGPRLEAILHRKGEYRGSDGERFLDAKGRVNPRYTLSDGLWTYLQAYASKHRAAGNGFGCSVFGPTDISRTLSARYYKDGSEALIGQGSSRNPRKLTPRECARLMGFPDSFRIPVSDTRAYKQFGNSVIVPLMAAVARGMKPGIMKLKDGPQDQYELMVA
jgi:DNA (cytosine-5)-methyltransferase 1